jgi:hypothetical protein
MIMLSLIGYSRALPRWVSIPLLTVLCATLLIGCGGSTPRPTGTVNPFVEPAHYSCGGPWVNNGPLQPACFGFARWRYPTPIDGAFTYMVGSQVLTIQGQLIPGSMRGGDGGSKIVLSLESADGHSWVRVGLIVYPDGLGITSPYFFWEDSRPGGGVMGHLMGQTPHAYLNDAIYYSISRDGDNSWQIQISTPGGQNNFAESTNNTMQPQQVITGEMLQGTTGACSGEATFSNIADFDFYYKPGDLSGHFVFGHPPFLSENPPSAFFNSAVPSNSGNNFDNSFSPVFSVGTGRTC